jgi:hypothetical protein
VTDAIIALQSQKFKLITATQSTKSSNVLSVLANFPSQESLELDYRSVVITPIDGV